MSDEKPPPIKKVLPGFPDKKHEYIRTLLDIDPSDKDNVTLELLCNILLQLRENQELIHYLYRAWGVSPSGYLRDQLEGWHEQEQTKLSLFLSKFAHNIEFRRVDDKMGGKSSTSQPPKQG